MAYRVLRANELNFDPEILAEDHGVLLLRRVDASGEYDRSQPLPATGGVCSTETIFMRALDIEEGWRLVVPLVYQTLGSNREYLGTTYFQIWDGTDWYFYDETTSTWEVVVDLNTDWGTTQNSMVYFANYPGIHSRIIRVRCKVVPDVMGHAAPRLHGIVLIWACNHLFNAEEDVLRSLSEMCQSIVIPVTSRTQLLSATNQFPLDPRFTVLASGTWRVYNLSQDPGKTTNLFSSWSDPDVVMTAVQPVDSNIEVQYEGYAPIYLSADDEDYFSTNPSIVIFKDENSRIAREWSQAPHRVLLPEPGLKTFRREHLAETLEVPIRITCQSDRHEEVLRMGEAIARHIQIHQRTPSWSWGAQLPFKLYTDSLRQTIDISSGLYIYSLPLQVHNKQWDLSRNSEIEDALKELRIRIGDSNIVWQTLLLQKT